MLQNTMQEISDSIANSQFSLIQTDPSYYFLKGKILFGVINKQLVINVEFPLKFFQLPAKVFEVEKIPQILPDNDKAKLHLTNIPSGVVIQKMITVYFYELTETELLQNFFEASALHLGCRIPCVEKC